jgi:cell division septation protein DedD
MPLIVQNILVLSLVAVCVAVVIWQATRTLVGKRSKLGSCCAKGCEPPKPEQQAAKTQFMPVEMLTLKKR